MLSDIWTYQSLCEILDKGGNGLCGCVDLNISFCLRSSAFFYILSNSESYWQELIFSAYLLKKKKLHINQNESPI